MTIECESLLCHKPATQRIVVPQIKPHAAFCDHHAAELLKWYERYRRIPGMVQVEPVTARAQET